MTIDHPRPTVRETLGRAEEEAALWAAFKARGSAEARERLFQIHLPFARRLARRRHNIGAADIDLQDLNQLAFAGLLEALDRFDPDQGVPFRHFAGRRITGSIVDGIVSMSEVREQISFRNRMRSERARSLAPAKPEATKVMDALTELVVGLALGFMLEESGFAATERSPAAASSGYQSLAWKETVLRLQSELARLPEQEQAVLRRHYMDGLSFEQIAELMKLSKGRISQVHKSALTLLRRRLPKSIHLFEG